MRIPSRSSVVSTATVSAPRLTPEGARVLQGRLKGIDEKLETTVKTRESLVQQMKVTRYGPGGFVAAQSQLTRLDAQVKFLTFQRNELADLLKRAG